MTDFKATYFIAILMVLFALPTLGQKVVTLESIETNKLPNGIRYEGKIKDAIRYNDSTGEHIIITTETGIYSSNKFKHESDGSDAELFAYNFLIQNKNTTLIWRIYDFISDCPVDIEVTFIRNTIQVTDLNNDGVVEVWIIYKTVCHGDISPYDMKIIMYQGNQKFAMRGHNKVVVGTDKSGHNQFIGGEYKFDSQFANGPIEFREFALKLWNKNISR